MIRIFKKNNQILLEDKEEEEMRFIKQMKYDNTYIM